MDTSLLSLYLKLNILLAAALLLWLATRSLARRVGFESSHAQQLKVARLLFLGLLVMACVALCAYGWLTTFATRLANGVTVVAGIDSTLARNVEVATIGFELRNAVVLFLFAGFGWQALRLARQVSKLRNIVNGATEWRHLGGVHLLVAPGIATPFSTRALGRKHVVLPMTLLASPRNLLLAVKHELQHVRNGDLEWVILLEAVKALCFWNPAAWLWHNEFDCLQEFACDEALVNDKHVTATAYGNCLLEVASASTGGTLIASSNMVPKFSFWKNHHSQLKRRILMLTQSSTKKRGALTSIAYAVLTGLGLLQTALLAFAADVDQDVVPIVRINPDYPQQALTEGMQGWVLLEFTITENGSVIDPLVVDNSVCLRNQAPEDCKPDDMFNASALAAIAKWRYTPKLENAQPVRYDRVKTIIRYALTDPADAPEDTEANVD